MLNVLFHICQIFYIGRRNKETDGEKKGASQANTVVRVNFDKNVGSKCFCGCLLAGSFLIADHTNHFQSDCCIKIIQCEK